MSRRDVLDASALLALLQDEPGNQNVQLAGAVINSVNFAEVVQKSIARGKPVEPLLEELTLLGLEVSSFSPQEALVAGRLHASTRSLGLSLADRVCLATAAVLGGIAVTADRAWDDPVHGVRVRLIR